MSTPIIDLIKKTATAGAVAFVVYVLIKRLTQSSSPTPTATKSSSNQSPTPTQTPTNVSQFPAVFLDKKNKKPITLIKRTDLSHDSAVLRFKLESETQVLGLPVGKHFKLVMPSPDGVVPGQWNGREDKEYQKTTIQRSYTPTSGDEHLGFVDLLVKFYLPGVKEQFPDGGKVSRQLNDLNIGDDIFIQGPFGRIEYKGNGSFKLGSKVKQVSKVGMMAGGSGITPMVQVIRYALQDKEDNTEFSLIYANQTEEDILLREELEGYAASHPERFKLHFTLDRPQEGWKGSSGFITPEMITENLPGPGDEVLMLMCGPPPMVKFACRANMEKLGYSKDVQVEF